MDDVELQPADRFEWERVVRRCVLPIPVKLVALTLATYANRDGTQVRPGVPRLAAVCGVSQATVRRHLDVVRGLGLVEKVRHGGGRDGKAAVFRLTIPSDLLERAQLLGPDEVSLPLPVSLDVPTELTTVSGVVDGPEPVYSAHDGERSSDSYSAQSEPLLRSSGASTALIQGEHLPRDQPLTHQEGRSPQVTTSPARGSPQTESHPHADRIAALRASIRTREDTPA